MARTEFPSKEKRRDSDLPGLLGQQTLPPPHPHAGDNERTLRRLEIISRLFDDAFRIPGTKVTLGWDALLGLIPVVGDGATTLVSSYFLWEAQRLGARKTTLIRMAGNVLIDFVVGTIPLVGDLIDVSFRANRRNMKILRAELQRHARNNESMNEIVIDVPDRASRR